MSINENFPLIFHAGQIGGNMGMFLGCSLLTLCEFLGFFASFLFRMKLTGNRNEPPNG